MKRRKDAPVVLEKNNTNIYSLFAQAVLWKSYYVKEISFNLIVLSSRFIISTMVGFWQDLINNNVLWTTIIAWAFAQGIKTIIGVIRGHKFDFYWILRTGGMPSAHSAAVVALALSLGKVEGFSSPLFALAALLALITMFDAQTWRRSIGVQARILNRMLDDINQGKPVEDFKVKELVGHTPVEVLGGIGVGICTFLFYN